MRTKPVNLVINYNHSGRRTFFLGTFYARKATMEKYSSISVDELIQINKLWANPKIREYFKNKLKTKKQLSGRKLTEKHKIKLSLANKNKHLSPKTEFRKGDPRITGKNNYRWCERIIKKCEICGKRFQVIQSHNRIKNCSKKCGNIYKSRNQIGKHKTGIYKNCLNCNKEIYVPKHYLNRKKYCSPLCRLKHINTVRKEELREKLSKSHIGQKSWNKGKRFPQYSGENHPNWKGGISYEQYGIEFNKYLKDKIRKRDNYECQLCGIKENEKKYIIHHIDYNKKNNNDNNLILLCNSCHSKTNFSRYFWKLQFI